MPLFFILVSIGVFFTYIDGAYSAIQTLDVEHTRLDQALSKAKDLQEARNSLIARYNTFPPGDIDRLQKMLPDHIDNVRLIIDIENIAKTYQLVVRDFGFSEEGAKDAPSNVSGETPVPTPAPEGGYGSVLMDFNVTATYVDFLAFLRDLERSLRLVDIVAVTLAGSETGLYNYTVTIKTYWLH